MQVFSEINKLKNYLKEEKLKNKTIGLVPTMGYLHEGHLSLVKQSHAENNITIVSIFVNPTQFGPNEDFERYPKDFKRDIELATKYGADIIFAPSAFEMYPEGYKTFVEVEEITDKLCGASRPGHFRGVTTVVTKLFNITQADRAYFGQKDAQQAIVVKQMVKDLNMNISIVVCPTIRDQNGLAKSSRNSYLSEEERKQAVIISKALFMAEKQIKQGEKNTYKIKLNIENMINEEPLSKIDYISIVDINTLDDISEITDKALIAIAVKFGTTRLIDNIIVEV